MQLDGGADRLVSLHPCQFDHYRHASGYPRHHFTHTGCVLLDTISRVRTDPGKV